MKFIRIIAAALAVSLLGTPAIAQVGTSGLISHWKLDSPDPVSGLWLDTHGTNHLLSFGAVATGTGKIGGAVQLDGISSFLYRASNASLSIGDSDFTATAWVWLDYIPSAGNNPTVFSKAGDGWGDEYWLSVPVSGGPDFGDFAYFSGGIQDGEWAYPSVGVADGTFPNTPGQWLSSGKWYFVALKREGLTLSISLDNGTPQTVSLIGGNPNTEDAFYVGAYGGAAILPGKIDELSLYNRALSSAEITARWNGGAGLPYPFE